MTQSTPKILLFDIETAPILAYVWGLWENNVSLNQIHKDWHVLSWSAKWLDSAEVLYMDQRKAANVEDDKHILKAIWKLLDEADIVVTQNGNSFDIKKLNERFIYHGFKPPSGYKKIDTRLLVKKHFGFVSTKLEYVANRLRLKNRKSRHSKFSGFDLWKACLAGNREAWNEMRDYNIQDVLVLEELFWKLQPWGLGINLNLYTDDTANICACGCTKLMKRGFAYTNVGKYQRYQCTQCGAWSRGRVNLFSPEKQDSLHITG